MTPPADPERYTNHRFPGEIISHGVWLSYRFTLSSRDVEELLFERGIMVSHEAIRQWCRKFGQGDANRLRRRRPQPGDKWHLDEVCLTIHGKRHYLWRAVDQDDHVPPPAASPRAAPAGQAARPQPLILSGCCGARRRPAGGSQGWPAAGAGRAGRPQARASAGRVAARWHGVGGPSRWKRPFDFPIPAPRLPQREWASGLGIPRLQGPVRAPEDEERA